MYRNITVEAEHNELILENSYGDKVIIPANKRNWVKQKLSEGCHGCIDSLVETLPVASQYAQDGSWFPSWMNPKNWGVTDYTDEGDFNTAYSKAKTAGEEEFLWNNKRYNTKYAGTPRQEVGSYGVNGETVIDKEPIVVHKYPMGTKYMGHISAENKENVVDYGPSGNYKGNQEDVIANYNVYNVNKDKFNEVSSKLPVKLDPFKPVENTWTLATNNCADNVCDAFGIPRRKGIETPNNTLKKIKNTYPTLDITGRSYFDYEKLTDNIIEEKSMGINKPKQFNLKKDADTILKDSKSLEGLIYSPDIKGTRVGINLTIALQKALTEKGYKLPKSIKKDGSFDGVLGDETKNALLEYRKSQNKTKQ